MKGTDLTQEQLDSAAHFLRSRMRGSRIPRLDSEVKMPFSDLVAIVAWYGALRYISGERGVDSLENPRSFEAAKPKLSLVPPE